MPRIASSPCCVMKYYYKYNTSTRRFDIYEQIFVSVFQQPANAPQTNSHRCRAWSLRTGRAAGRGRGRIGVGRGSYQAVVRWLIKVHIDDPNSVSVCKFRDEF